MSNNKGARAASVGNAFRDSICTTLQQFSLSYETEYRSGCFDQFGREIRPDISVAVCSTFPRGAWIECKWQESSGSSEEKIAFTVEKMQEFYSTPGWLVIGGEASERMRKYAEARCDGNLHCVFTSESFFVWIRDQRSGESPPVARRFTAGERWLF